MGKRKAKPTEDQEMTTRGVRMTKVYATWLDRLATSERIRVASLIDRAVAAYAKQAGFEPPPVRVP
jgi:hypothetical protein